MRGSMTLVRWLLAAALILVAPNATADIAARYDDDTGVVVVTGLDPDQRAALVAEPRRVSLRRAAAAQGRGMLTSLRAADVGLHVIPRFALRTGQAFVVDLHLDGQSMDHAAFEVADAKAPTPVLETVFPSTGKIPANTLRFYLTFSQPMARGQVRDAIRLEQADGRPVLNPFLNLDTELWDPSQRRLTILLDPGRIKQGVGPNRQAGAPLESGGRYTLIVSRSMKSAAGAEIGTDQRVVINVGPAERRAVDPAAWRVDVPDRGSTAPLRVSFDRLMDKGAIGRSLTVVDASGTRVDGIIRSDGREWSLTPTTEWRPGTYRLVIDAALEDVAGNTVRSAFDADAGTMGRTVVNAETRFRVSAE